MAAARAGLSRTALASRMNGERDSANIAALASRHHSAISAYASRAGPNVKAPSGGPLARSIATPASPPNQSGKVHAAAATSSPMPSVIIANAVPARRVEMKPSSAPHTAAPAPPISGSSTSGTPARLNRCAAISAPRPEYAACPNDSNPVSPSSRL
ncbi:ZK84.1-like protein [Paraburkholderia graminis C4D1M]|uniref:ZK84.1-like protein n=1 Tax=Paraburkholderia graminis (strain ATCC 700544 / DSM 17151 / LMG 18924 / NCIMB 13744 / C4D1M) TaxID=396598 RepID=B1G7W2_PARG4|nr:ZK84.1-like protein [Paraburkholderia graminis C4D1M]